MTGANRDAFWALLDARVAAFMQARLLSPARPCVPRARRLRCSLLPCFRHRHQRAPPRWSQERAALRPLLGDRDWEWLTAELATRVRRELPAEVPPPPPRLQPTRTAPVARRHAAMRGGRGRACRFSCVRACFVVVRQ
eukprot:4170607-Prymnesium_polylepis.1